MRLSVTVTLTVEEPGLYSVVPFQEKRIFHVPGPNAFAPPLSRDDQMLLTPSTLMGFASY